MNKKIYMKSWVERNREHIREYDRQRYARNPLPKIERAKKLYSIKGEQIKAGKKKYYEEHKDEARECNRKRRASNPEKWRLYEYTRRENILTEKAGRPRPEICEVCGANEKIVYDHDHATGKFRGWICFSCNTALGHARDNVEVLYKLIDYLKKNI
jgi:hypothetical protein